MHLLALVAIGRRIYIMALLDKIIGHSRIMFALRFCY